MAPPALALLLLLLACGWRATLQDVIYGTIQQLAVQYEPGTNSYRDYGHEQHQLFLRTPVGELRRLLFPVAADHPSPKVGMYVMVRSAPLAGCTVSPMPGNPICCSELMMSEALLLDSDAERFGHQQVRGGITLKTAVFLLDVCGSGPATDVQSLERVLFERPPPVAQEANTVSTGAGGTTPGTVLSLSDQPGSVSGQQGSQESGWQYTVEGMFDSCSWGACNFSRATGSIVVPQVIPVPCDGHTPSGADFHSTCDRPGPHMQACQCYNNYQAWGEWAVHYAQHTLGVDVASHHFKLFILPANSDCDFAGMGFTSCAKDPGMLCHSFVNGKKWTNPMVYVHEIGHNLGLEHAGTSTAFDPTGASSADAYSDQSSTMGMCCSIRCYSTPQTYQLGWSQPLANLSSSSFPPGRWLTFNLPASSLSPRHFVKIRPDWSQLASSQDAEFFVSYRNRSAYDVGLNAADGFGDRVMVYSEVPSNTGLVSRLEHSIHPGQRWLETRLDTQVTYVVMGQSDTAMMVGMCRTSEPVERSCSDGLDNDCDGLQDADDPDCVAQRMAEA